MAENITTLQDFYTTHEAFGETQSAKKILGRLVIAENEANVLDDIFEQRKFPLRTDKVQYRVRVHQKITKADIDSGKFNLGERVAPQALSLTYAKVEYSASDYGTKIGYTAKEVYENADDVVHDCGDELARWVVELKNRKRIEALASSKSVITPADTVMATFLKARGLFLKKKGFVKRFDNMNWLAVTTTEIAEKLAEELLAANGTNYGLPESAKVDLMNGEVDNFKGFAVRTVDVDDYMSFTNESTNYQYIFFIGKPRDGGLPAAEYKLDGGAGYQLYNNGLGSGLLTDKDGNLTTDDNHQQGTIAVNLRKLADVVTDDTCILVCKFALANIDTTEVKGLLDNNSIVANAAVTAPQAE